MLALWWNRFCGSYFFLIAASRWYLAGPYAVVVELGNRVDVAPGTEGMRAQRLPEGTGPCAVGGQKVRRGADRDNEHGESR